MMHPPRYRPYAGIRPASKPRWRLALALMLVIGAVATTLLWPTGKAAQGPVFWFFATLLAPLLWLIAWLLRQFVYQLAQGNRVSYERLVALRLAAWWQVRRRAAHIRQLALLGPFGSSPPQLRELALGTLPAPLPAVGTRRWQAALADDEPTRCTRLAQALARQLLLSDEQVVNTKVGRVFWHGSEAAWQAFRQTLSQDSSWQLPEATEAWQGLASLDAAIDVLHQTPDIPHVLCAGVTSPPESQHSNLPASDLAFAWLLAADGGPVKLHRAEAIDASQGDTTEQVGTHCLQLAGEDAPLPHALVLDQQEAELLQAAGWPAINGMLGDWLGLPSPLALPAIISVAALRSRHHQQACGWMAADISGAPCIGVLAPHESTNQA